MKNAERFALWGLVILALIGPPIALRGQNLFNRNDGTFAQVDAPSVTGQALVLLKTTTVSSVASLADTTTLTNASYKIFHFYGYSIVNGTAATNFSSLLSTNGGSSYFNTGGNYQFVELSWTSGSTNTTAIGQFTARAGLNCTTTLNNAASTPMYFHETIFDPASVTHDTRIEIDASYGIAGGFMEHCAASGYLGAVGANAIEWLPSSGNFSGTIEAYGQL